MGFVSILDNKKREQTEEVTPAFFVDLNLDQVIEQIQAQTQVPVRKFFYQLPEDKAGEDYRRAVYEDVKKETVYAFLTEFAMCMEERKKALAKKTAVSIEIQHAAWHMQEVALYCEGFFQLYEGLCKAEICSEGLLALKAYLQDYVSSKEFIAMRKSTQELRKMLQGFHLRLVFENEQISVTEEQVSGTYDRFLKTALGVDEMQMKSPFAQSVDMSELEQELIQKIAQKNPDFFEGIQKFFKKHKIYADEILLQFADEISYYLAYYAFQQKMELQGYSFTRPEVEEDKDMSAKGLYDLALACASLKTGKEVICNDMVYHKEDSFFVLTGPNQGGKTTFARSLGQLVYFCKMGLDVPADAANVHSFSGILTHFSVEESIETGRGKLMEELMRLKPMMESEGQGAFVVINELFTTAANYDACIMGKKVLEHFIAQSCRGIYVTHLKELADAHESVVSMRAMLDEKRMQSFRISRQPAEDTACAMNQVNKHRLTYEQLKERLG